MRRRPSILRRALREIGLYVILPVALLIGVRLVWGWSSAHRMARVRESLPAKGIRVDPPQVSVPDPENAALKVIEAVDASRLTTYEQSLISEAFSSTGPVDSAFWTDAHKREIRGILSKLGPSFARIKEAADLPKAHWPVSTLTGARGSLDRVGKIRELSFALNDDAFLAHAEHRDRDALEDYRLVLELARIENQDCSEIAHLVAVALQSTATLGIEQFQDDWHPVADDASIAVARQVITRLNERARDRDSLALSIEVEINRCEFQPAPSLPVACQWWFKPLYEDSKARYMQQMADSVPMLRAADWPTIDAVMHKAGAPRSLLRDLTFVSESGADSLYMALLLHLRSSADCAASAVMLAARVYEAEHGVLPAQAAMLVPGYLPQLPADPFAEAGRPLGYRLDKQGPTVWSVGENCTDEGGHVLLNDKGYRVRRYGGSSDKKMNPPDLVFGSAWLHAPVEPPPPPAPAPIPIMPPTFPPAPGEPAETAPAGAQ